MDSQDIRKRFYEVANHAKFIELGGELNLAIARNIENYADWFLVEIERVYKLGQKDMADKVRKLLASRDDWGNLNGEHWEELVDILDQNE